MNFEAKYGKRSRVTSDLQTSNVEFSTNLLREATYFRGEVRLPLILRDALATLYAVVVSDLKFRVRDRIAFRAWLEEQDAAFLRSLPLKSESLRIDIEKREARLAELNQARSDMLAPFRQARKKYFQHAFEDAYELDLILDPVISVHPDQLSFEAFSRDESSYARVALSYDLFGRIDEFACGTTNIDFGARLHRQFDRMRSYRKTQFEVGAGGFTASSVQDGAIHEKKIDVPASWVDGFLQVQSVMTLGLRRVRLAPIDIFNICRFLGRHRARKSPRALRWNLEPGQPTTVVIEPWNFKIQLSPRSIYEGPKSEFVRTWGRDRLQVLKRILPATQGVDLYLAGHGLPSIYVLDLGEVTFTLGLSGWTDQDWTEGASFELLARRLDASPDDLTAVDAHLLKERSGSGAQLATATGISETKAAACASFLCQNGRAMFDLSTGVYRHRDLFFRPFDAAKAIAAAEAKSEMQNPRAKAARTIFEAGQARFTARRPHKGGYKLSGSVRGTDGERVRPLLTVDQEGRILDATCTCKHFKKHRMTKGPCEHMLALRLAHMDRLEKEGHASDGQKGG